MGMYFNPTNRMFQFMLHSEFYVDKTRLAVFTNNLLQRDGRIVCVSRPHRFGKSVDADMLVAYYSRGCDFRAQFQGLDVSYDPSYERHLNAHNVIKLDITQFMPHADEPARIGDSITRRVARELERVFPTELENGWDSLADALTLIEDATGEGFVFIVNEWDCVIREAADDRAAQRAYLDYLRDLFKGRSYVDAVYMTGILPIKKCGAHSALNTFTEYSLTDLKTLADLVGFTDDEVRRLCHRFDMDFDGVQRDLVADSRELQMRTLSGDEAYVADAVSRAHDNAAGPAHYNDEQALRAAVKLAYIWSINDYLRVDKLPGGRGYADAVYIPKKGSPLPPMVVELKWDRPIDAAIGQIKARKYPAALNGLGGECVLVGITYHDDGDVHECSIERVRI